MALYYRVRTVCTGLAGSPYLTTHNFEVPTTATAQSVVDQVSVFWGDLAPWIVTQCSFQVQPEVDVVDVATGNIQGVETAIGISVNGESPNTPEWTAKQGLMALRTDNYLDGRRIQGHLYVPGVPGGSGEQTPIQAYQSTLTQAGLALVIGSNNNGAPWSVVTRPRESPAREGRISNISLAVSRNYWSILRSRRQ